MSLIKISNCRIENTAGTVVPSISWEMNPGEAWLVIGPNGGGKADFVNALSSSAGMRFVPNGNSATQNSQFHNIFHNSVELVSLERAARLIQEERENDESDYVEGGVDIGRTGRVFIAESLPGITIKKNHPLPPEVFQIDSNPAVELCGIKNILDRGLKYMSTGEIRRTLLARGLISGKKLLILSDPFAGLDAESRKILLDFFTEAVKKQTNVRKEESNPSIILGMERWHEIPDSITHVLEFTNKEISFSGARKEYEKLLEKRNSEKSSKSEEIKKSFEESLSETFKDTAVLQNENKTSEQNTNNSSKDEILVQMNNVNVSWGDHHVLKNLNWNLKKNQHWLIRGPNGSGKTTFLELITGDNGQVYSNDVWLFGRKRGTGESIWEIKEMMGIVSYRMHVEYRMVGNTNLRDVIVSGFRDSIGLYGAASDMETSAALKWLKLGGFAGREQETFGSLSYGEQRAILILRSAVKCPQILILDEPCHGLDENYRDKILHLLEIIGQNGTSTMLHVTHDPSEKLPCEKHILELHPNDDPMFKIIVE
ncbi:MAG: ATP-binding cassette domain-containing protein [Treponema sp.]|nr:ATP-binding cassette domain-containing protein [Treponema sp.]